MNQTSDLEVFVVRPLLNVRQAQTVLGVSRATVWRLTQSGAIPVVRVGSNVRFRQKDVERFIATHSEVSGVAR